MKASILHGRPRQVWTMAVCWILFWGILLVGCRGASPMMTAPSTSISPTPTWEPTKDSPLLPTPTVTPNPSFIIYKSIDFEEKKTFGVYFSSNGKYMTAITEDGIYIYEINHEPSELRKMTQLPISWTKVLGARISNDGQLVATFLNDIDIWDVSKKQKIHTLKMGQVRGLAISPNGKILAATSCYSLKIWDLVTGSELISWIPEHKEGDDCTINALSSQIWLSDETIVIKRPKDVAIWNFNREKEPLLLVLEGIELSRTIDVSPDKQLIAFAPHNVEIISLFNKEPQHKIRISQEGWWAGRLLFSPDGHLLVAWFPEENSLKIFNIADEKELQDLKIEGIYDFAFSENTSFLILGTLENNKGKIHWLKIR